MAKLQLPLSIVLAGGEGKRLMPLTADRAKPAVPFGGSYRLVDFVLSNLANANMLKVAVLTQYKSHSLVFVAWKLHHSGSGSAASWATLVYRQCGCNFAELQFNSR
jgi:ADP-glucose pyrophosphorylase